MKSDANQDTVAKRAQYFRQQKIPCDVIGLEPGWQTRSYSCSYIWSNRFPQHKQLIYKLRELGFKINLWEHAYVHPSSPIYKLLKQYAGNFTVWKGIVPDFLLPLGKRNLCALP
jgi:Alpha-glucosidases, family 31 of glycosyl hydrolases